MSEGVAGIEPAATIELPAQKRKTVQEAVDAFYDDEGLWCIWWRRGEEVWMEKYSVIVYDYDEAA